MRRLERVTPGDAGIFQGPVLRVVVTVWPHNDVLHNGFLMVFWIKQNTMARTLDGRIGKSYLNLSYSITERVCGKVGMMSRWTGGQTHQAALTGCLQALIGHSRADDDPRRRCGELDSVLTRHSCAVVGQTFWLVHDWQDTLCGSDLAGCSSCPSTINAIAHQFTESVRRLRRKLMR